MCLCIHDADGEWEGSLSVPAAVLVAKRIKTIYRFPRFAFGIGIGNAGRTNIFASSCLLSLLLFTISIIFVSRARCCVICCLRECVWFYSCHVRFDIADVSVVGSQGGRERAVTHKHTFFLMIFNLLR